MNSNLEDVKTVMNDLGVWKQELENASKEIKDASEKRRANLTTARARAFIMGLAVRQSSGAVSESLLKGSAQLNSSIAEDKKTNDRLEEKDEIKLEEIRLTLNEINGYIEKNKA
ncbi:hypothetical protein H7992_07100 [Sporosarcina sp. resist]|uniref:hypothetical protein n=1 Tax=Sporosarcina sp. resist TaxID=2762563 RepID=UPI00164DBFBB|nr:hypothetical protein [Sporosarcina sp. resist]QNK89425.1 hypothetical protein H7992_07100 [Sporosarcina sp. resist]